MDIEIRIWRASGRILLLAFCLGAALVDTIAAGRAGVVGWLSLATLTACLVTLAACLGALTAFLVAHRMIGRRRSARVVPGRTVPGRTVPGRTVPGRTVPGRTIRGGIRIERRLRLGPRWSMVPACAVVVYVVLRAAQTGRLGWAGVVAVLLAATVLLTDPHRPHLRRAALAAGVFAAAAVLITNMFSGGNDARTLTVAITAIIVPLVLSDKALDWLKPAHSRTGQRLILIALTSVFACLGWFRADWVPGVLHECFTPPTSNGATVLRTSGDGRHCYGLIDAYEPRWWASTAFARTAFGRSGITTDLEIAALKNNVPVRRGDLTVVWMGTLSCEPDPADPTGCTDGIDYPNERDQLRALLLAQRAAHHHLHVVIADILPNVAYADAVAELIVAHRDALGRRIVVMGGTDSRDQTERAINLLLNAGIPFVAPSLLGDLDAAGRSFVHQPGYFQLSSPNRSYAVDLMAQVRRFYPAKDFPNGVDLDVYQLPNTSDQYTMSLLNDVVKAAGKPFGTYPIRVRHVSGPARFDTSICEPARRTTPTAVFFADRWTTFSTFLTEIDTVCAGSRPQHVFADGSASRFMANYHLRATSTIGWPVDYYVPGPGCPSRRLPDLARRIPVAGDELAPLFGTRDVTSFTCRGQKDNAAPMCTLDAATVRPDTPCDVNELGTSLAPAWDAVMLAERIMTRDNGGRSQLSQLSTDGVVTLPGGTQAQVDRGQLVTPTVRIEMWHANSVADPTDTWLLD